MDVRIIFGSIIVGAAPRLIVLTILLDVNYSTFNWFAITSVNYSHLVSTNAFWNVWCIMLLAKLHNTMWNLSHFHILVIVIVTTTTTLVLPCWWLRTWKTTPLLCGYFNQVSSFIDLVVLVVVVVAGLLLLLSLLFGIESFVLEQEWWFDGAHECALIMLRLLLVLGFVEWFKLLGSEKFHLLFDRWFLLYFTFNRIMQSVSCLVVLVHLFLYGLDPYLRFLDKLTTVRVKLILP